MKRLPYTDIIADQALLIMELRSILARLERSFVASVGDASPYAKLALDPVREILNRGKS